jgi:hypothetical protein
MCLQQANSGDAAELLFNLDVNIGGEHGTVVMVRGSSVDGTPSRPC